MSRYEKYKDRFISGLDRRRFIRLWLHSGRYRDPIAERNEDAKTIKANNEFRLYFKIPNSFTQSSDRHLVLLINGYDEIPVMQSLYWSEDSSIIEWLPNLASQMLQSSGADTKVAVGLVPIPFHHWRRPVVGDYRDWTSSKMILFDPLRLYLGFNQLMYDLDELLLQLSTPVHDRYDTYFSGSTKVHLLGYSLGGLAALSYFLKDGALGANKITSCHLLASGVDLRHIDFVAARVPINVTVKIRNYYSSFHNDVRYEPRIESRSAAGKKVPQFPILPKGKWKDDLAKYSKRNYPNDQFLLTMFERNILGYDIQNDERTLLDDSWRKSNDRLFYYLPDLDEVNNYGRISSLAPSGVTIQKTDIHDCGHFLYDCDSWKENVISSFGRPLCNNMSAALRI